MLPSPPVRVGYVVKRYPRYSETFIVNEILAHEDAGFPVEIFALRAPIDTHFQDIISRVRASVHYLPHKGIRAAEYWSALEAAGSVLPGFWPALEIAGGEDPIDIYQAALLAVQARAHGITHLHAHFASSPTSVSRLAARFAQIPYSFTAHAKDIFHEEVSQTDLERKLSDAAAVITVSDFNVDYLTSLYGSSADRVRRVYNGLDLDRFQFRGSVERPPRIVAVGRLVEKKGFDVLIDAFALLVARGSHFTAQIIGTGELEAELRARIDAHGLHRLVELSGPRPQREVIELVQQAAVFAAPSVDGTDGNRDGLPTVLLEAMALGTPSVSTPVTGIPEIVRHEETGLLVPQRDPGNLADALDRLLVEPGLGSRLAAQARRLIETDFDIVRNAAQVRKLFEPHSEPVTSEIGALVS